MVIKERKVDGKISRHSNRYSINYKKVKYELLVKQPEKELENICNFLNIKLEIDRMLNMIDFIEVDNSSFRNQSDNQRKYNNKIRKLDFVDRKICL